MFPRVSARMRFCMSGVFRARRACLHWSRRGISCRNRHGGGVIGETSIVFVGLQHKEVVRDMMRRAKCVLLPSEWYETFGLTVIEAMTVGTPVVVSDLGALLELVK